MFVYVNDLRTQHNKYTDVFVPVYAQTIVKDAFAGTPWQGDAAWTPDQAEAYRDLVTKYITLASLRLLAAVHTVDTTTIVAGSPTERADIAERCIVARAPFCTPPYLKAYHALLKQVILGNTEGGVVLDQAALEAAALAGSDRPARGPIANVAVGGEDATELVRLRAANAALQQKIDRVPEVVEDGAPTIPLAQLKMFAAMAAAAAAQLQDSKEPGAVVTATRTLTGWDKVNADVKTAIISGALPHVLKLSRANQEKLEGDSHTADGSRKIQLGQGASISLPGGADDVVTLTSLHDSALWSGISAFNRLFSMMASMPEEECPRQKLADLLDVWSEIWDSPRSTRYQKLTSVLAFWRKYKATLGDGIWPQTLNSDNRILRDNLFGPNPRTCAKCKGSGEASASGQHPTPSTSCNAATPSSRGPANPSPNKRKRPNGSNSNNHPCKSRLIKGAVCANPSACPFTHDGSCVACGGSCTSTSACSSWDAHADKVNKRWGKLIKKLSA